MIKPAYVYRAVVVRVVDGDTVDADIDLGFSTYTRQRLRLAGINAPEVRGGERVEGEAAKQWLIDRLRNVDWVVTVETQKDRQGKYGRYLATLHDDRGDINWAMVERSIRAERP